LLAYLFVIGAIVGLVLFAVDYLRKRFHHPDKKTKPRRASGRIIDSDDWRKL
jgi:uncharacterized membrane protein YciS (DUF1049 family)